MDYSTISNKTTFTEADELTGGELSERYYLLRKQYDNLTTSYEATKQELYDTKRSYQTALDVQSHLTVELEAFQAEQEKQRNDLNNRITLLQEEISALREERSDTAERHGSEIKKLQSEIQTLKEERDLAIRKSPERDNSELEEVRSALATATSDASAVRTALEEARAEINSWRLKVEELVSEIAEMREAAEIRREELKAAAEREAVALADLSEARAMLHQADAQDLQPHAAKGNSIFAEVEDKRQEMVKNLMQMKQANSRLKRELANKQSELEALLHEKQTIWEQQEGNAAHYDQEFMESYQDRVSQLEALTERQRREVEAWFGKVADPPARGWLPGVIQHFKNECQQLREEVLSRGAAQLASATQVRELRRKITQMAATSTKQSPEMPVDDDKSDNDMHKYECEQLQKDVLARSELQFATAVQLRKIRYRMEGTNTKRSPQTPDDDDKGDIGVQDVEDILEIKKKKVSFN